MQHYLKKKLRRCDDATPIHVVCYDENNEKRKRGRHELLLAAEHGIIGSDGIDGKTKLALCNNGWTWVISLVILGIISFISVTQVGPTSERILDSSVWSGPRDRSTETVLACYYSTPGENGSAGLRAGSVPPRLCTHVLLAFARVSRATLQLAPAQHDALRDLTALKTHNHNLKIMLSVGGAGESDGFSDMVKDHASRKVFIKSIKSVLRNHSLDGIDLDWEFPVLHYGRKEVLARERQHFSQLLREVRMEFDREKRGYILSVALAAPQTIVDVAYDIDQINLYVDFANLMTYDFHSYTKFTPFTGFNSPLYARSTESLFPATLNINYTVEMYTSKGLDRNKIVVGIPTYGHTFKLVNEENASVGSPASGWGAVGSRGFADYSALCALAAARRRWDAEAKVPFLSRGAEWASYEKPRSVRLKAAFVRTRGLRGAMIYSLNADDYAGTCAPSDRFPLTGAVASALRLRHRHQSRGPSARAADTHSATKRII